MNANSPVQIVHCNQGLAELHTEMHVRTAAMRLIFLHLRRNALNFVQRSAKLLQRGIASAQPALPLPFLGVSSLNLGRLDFPDGLFFCPVAGESGFSIQQIGRWGEMSGPGRRGPSGPDAQQTLPCPASGG